MPPKNKRNNANTHDRRHESGLAPPAGKKQAKNKLNGLVNGHVNPNRSSAASDQPSAINRVDSGPLPETSSHDRSDGAAGASRVGGSLSGMGDYKQEEELRGSYNQTSGGHKAQDVLGTTQGELHGDTGSSPSQEHAQSGPYSRTTVIGPLALQDAVAILVFLLQLPPPALTLVQFCFAYLTFGSPSGGFSLSSLTSSPDWLQSQGGHPSIATMVMVDFLVLAVWFVLPLGKDFTLDLAQCAIAITLGGGVVGRGASRNCITCASIVAISHASGYKTLQQYTANIFSPLTSRAGSWPSRFNRYFPWPPSRNPTPRTWPRIILEVHIITQAIIRIVRRWINRRSEPKPPSTKKIETDFINGAPTSTVSNPNDVIAEAGRSTSSDGRPPGPSPASLTGEKSISSGKKRRKQATHVRLQQPFWAAIANSKVACSKDLQRNQASADTQDAAASNNVNTIVDVQDQVWITRIFEDGAQFCAILPSSKIRRTSTESNVPESDDVSIELHEGDLYVRINGARWSGVSFGSEGHQNGVARLTGRISGLTSATNFHVEFVRASDTKVILSTNLLIRPVASSEKAISPQLPQPLRPSSPTTTLKQSIASAESQLSELRNNSKKIRRDNRNATSSLNREVSNLESRLSSFGNTDERQRQRRIHFSQNIKQLEESASAIASEIENMGEIPEDEQEALYEVKQIWQSKRNELTSVKQQLQEAKAEDDRIFNSIRSAKDHAQQKRERLVGRLSKLDQNEKDLIAANNQIRQDKTRRNSQRASVITAYEANEQDLIQKIRWYEEARAEADARAAQFGQQPYTDPNFHSHYSGPSSIPQTPENTFADPAGPTSRAPLAPSAYSNIQFTMGSTPVHSRRGSFRPRSSSMLSDVSGFTNDEVAPPIPIGLHHSDSAPEGYTQGRKRSNGSGSGSFNRSASSSQRDNTNSPAPKLSPIGGRGSPWKAKPS